MKAILYLLWLALLGYEFVFLGTCLALLADHLLRTSFVPLVVLGVAIWSVLLLTIGNGVMMGIQRLSRRRQ